MLTDGFVGLCFCLVRMNPSCFRGLAHLIHVSHQSGTQVMIPFVFYIVFFFFSSFLPFCVLVFIMLLLFTCKIYRLKCTHFSSFWSFHLLSYSLMSEARTFHLFDFHTSALIFVQCIACCDYLPLFSFLLPLGTLLQTFPSTNFLCLQLSVLNATQS